jgi:hypothetical protein
VYSWVIRWAFVFLLLCTPLPGHAGEKPETLWEEQLLKAAGPGMKLHSLYEVDASDAIYENLYNALRYILSKNKIKYKKLRLSGTQTEIEIRNADQIESAKNLLKELPQTTVTVGQDRAHLIIRANKILISDFNIAATRTEVPLINILLKCYTDLSENSLEPFAIQINKTNKIALYFPIGFEPKSGMGSICTHSAIYGYKPVHLLLLVRVYDPQLVKQEPTYSETGVFSIDKQLPDKRTKRYLIKKRVLLYGKDVLSGRVVPLPDGAQSIQLDIMPWSHTRHQQGQEVAVIRNGRILSTAIVHSKPSSDNLMLRLRENKDGADQLLNGILTSGMRGARKLLKTWEKDLQSGKK